MNFDPKLSALTICITHDVCIAFHVGILKLTRENYMPLPLVVVVMVVASTIATATIT